VVVTDPPRQQTRLSDPVSRSLPRWNLSVPALALWTRLRFAVPTGTRRYPRRRGLIRGWNRTPACERRLRRLRA